MTLYSGALHSSATPEPRIGRYRYAVITLIWVGLFFCGFDRAVVSILLVDAGFLNDLGLQGHPEKQGLLMTFLLLPYALSNIFLGATADYWGPRRVLTVMVSLFSAAAIWMGSATSYSMMLVGRVIRGTAEGPLFPVANRYVRNWFPPSERGGANAIWISAQRVGMTVGVPLFTMAIGIWGWRSAFFLQASFFIVIVIPTIFFLTADTPENLSRVRERERVYIASGRAGEMGKGGTAKGDISTLLGKYQFWLMVAYHFTVLATFSGLTTWLPKYLRDARGFDVKQMVLFASLPYLGSFLSSLTFGFLSDRIGRRALLCTTSLSGASVCIGVAALVADPVLSGVLMMCGMIMWGMGTPVYYAIMQRIVPASIMATGIGIDNGLANFGSAMAPAIVGFLIAATGSYLAGLLFIAVLGFIGAAGAAVLAVQGY